jgi:saccharopine dehydrogenase (NADP+, L-glutamate forming)
MKKNILVLGAGSVAPPLVQYFINQPEIKLTVADQDFNKVKKLTFKSPQARRVHLDIRNKEKTRALISDADIVISILPHIFHPEISHHCVDLKTNMITASYVTESMKKLHPEARRKGILLLNEIGLDPGIDHMEAMRIINDVKKENGTIMSFISYCGGLPAPEANTNPLGYKFSWSPKGVLLAGKNPAYYLKNNKKIFVHPEKLFQSPSLIRIKGVGNLEGYPNRNSISYIDLYQIQSTKTILRGTLRYKGWCSFMNQAVRIGLLDEEIRNWKMINRLEFIRKIAGLPGKEDLKSELSSHLKLEKDSLFIQVMDWLDFFNKQPLPLKEGSPLDILVALMQEKCIYNKGERDMIVLQHRLMTKNEDKNLKEIVSTLIDFGIPDGETAMSRTVGLPLAIAARNILNGRIKITGVQIPTHPEIYEPILTELRESGIKFDTTIKEK